MEQQLASPPPPAAAPAAPPPPATTATTNTTPGSAVKVQATAARKVTYRFFFPTQGKSKVVLDYAVEVNGQIRSEFANATRGVEHGQDINITVQEGEIVRLYLNSDAEPGQRTQPVYAVTAGNGDAVITIREKTGQHTDADTPTLVSEKVAPKSGSITRQYSAPLTGNLWLKISYKFTQADAKRHAPPNTPLEVIDAVSSLYDGSTGTERSLVVSIPVSGGAPKQVKIVFPKGDADQNCRDNITADAYNLVGEGITRVHPGGYYAIIQSALEVGVTEVTMSSCWRPMVGSIAHRNGRGLDFNWINDGTQSIRLNRAELTYGKKGYDSPWVTDDEVDLHKKLNAAEADAAAKKKVAETAQAAASQAGATEEAKAKAAQAKADAAAAADARNKAKDAWEAEKNAHEPEAVKSLRTALMRCRCIKQVLDPWFMDTNTRDKIAGYHNRFKSGNDQNHRHHFHITVSKQ